MALHLAGRMRRQESAGGALLELDAESAAEPDSQKVQTIELIAKCRRGDEAASTAVYARYVDRLRGLVRARLSSRLASRFDSADVVHSAFRSFFVGLRDARFDVDTDEGLWQLLAEITLHKLYRQAARHRAQKRSALREEGGLLLDGITLPAVSSVSAPDVVATVADELRSLFAKLPPQGQRVVELRMEGETLEDIAARLDVNERTVRRWLTRAGRILEGQSAPALRSGDARHSLPRLDYGDFLLEKMIGAGGSGKVYRAVDRRSGALVALKFLRKSLLSDRRAVQRFAAESEVVSGLVHPHVMPVLGHGRTPAGGYFFAMQLAAGDLQSGLGQHSIVRIIAWLRQAAVALAHAHQAGVIHCDLKPSNLLVAQDGSILVTDFGLAQRLRGARPVCGWAGTPAYMAPEQIDAAHGELSPRTDVYGLGATLYALLTGRPPHQGSNTKPNRQGTAIPTWLGALCLRCLAEDPADRFPSMEDVIAFVDKHSTTP